MTAKYLTRSRLALLLLPLVLLPLALPAAAGDPGDRVDVVSRPRSVAIKPGATECTPKPADATLRQRIVDAAAGEWQRFRFPVLDQSRGDLRELPAGPGLDILPRGRNPRAGRVVSRLMRMGTFEDSRRIDAAVGGYWAIIPIDRQATPPVIELQNRIWQAYHGAGWAQPWSAAFISWVMCDAGLTDAQFVKSPVHYRYIDQAIGKAANPADPAIYTAVDATAASPRPGDLVCSDRYPGNRYVTVADRRAFLGSPRPTHCDVVVKVDRARLRVFAIGGNVINSVTLKILPLRIVHRNGRREPVLRTPADMPGAPPWFALLRLNAPGTASLDRSPVEVSQ